MSPPLPPSPPLGPPRGTNFSLRKARQPFPPLPASTRILASSMNMLHGRDSDTSGDRQRLWNSPRTMERSPDITGACCLSRRLDNKKRDPYLGSRSLYYSRVTTVSGCPALTIQQVYE